MRRCLDAGAEDSRTFPAGICRRPRPMPIPLPDLDGVGAGAGAGASSCCPAFPSLDKHLGSPFSSAAPLPLTPPTAPSRLIDRRGRIRGPDGLRPSDDEGGRVPAESCCPSSGAGAGGGIVDGDE